MRGLGSGAEAMIYDFEDYLQALHIHDYDKCYKVHFSVLDN